MFRQYTDWLLLVVLVSTTIGGITAASWHYQKTLEGEITFLKDELRTFWTPDVEVDGVLYRIDKTIVVVGNDGKSFVPTKELSQQKKLNILRTAYFSTLTRIDPLFALDMANTEKLRESIFDLRTSLDAYAPFYTSTEERFLRSSVYPTEFLEELSHLEDIRQRIILAPRNTTTEEYLKQFEKTVYAYKKGIANLLTTYALVSNDTQEGDRFYFMGGYTTIPQFKTALALIEENMQATYREHKKRVLCIEGNTDQCPHLTEHLFPYSISDLTNSSKTVSLPTQVLENATLLEEYYKKDPRVDNKSFSHPIIALTSSDCFWEEETQFFKTFLREIAPGKVVLKREFLNDLYFYKLTEPVSIMEYAALLQSPDAEQVYIYQPIANTYMCPESGTDAAKINTLLSVQSLLKQHPIFGTESTKFNQEAEKLFTIEKKIRESDKILFESDIDEYVVWLISLLRNASGDRQVYRALEAERLLNIERILSLYQSKTAGFDELIYALVDESDYLKRAVQNNFKIDFVYVLISRANPILTFQAFNSTIQRDTRPSVLFPSTSDLKEAFNLVRYVEEKELKNTYTKDELPELMWRGHQVERPL